jgi:hypothetical protein
VPKPEVSKKVAAVWDELAGRATAEQTLTASTVSEFVSLCELTVQHRACLAALEKAGIDSDKGLGLARVYATLTQRVEGKMRAFRLAPMGKPLGSTQEKPKTALERLRDQRQGIHAVK